MLLSDAKIRAAKPSSKPFSLSDGDGLHLVIRPTGKKCWQLRYRFADREKTLSLGKYPLISLPSARDQKIDAKRLLHEGLDPSAKRRQDKQLAVFRDRNSFLAIAEEWHERNKDHWTKGHADDVWNRLTNHLIPTLGKRPITEIEPLELLSAIQRIEQRGATHMSHRVLQIAGSILNFAIITGRAKHNIVIGLSKALKPHREKHFPTLNPSELPDFYSALNRVRAAKQNKIALQLLMLTALRTGELRFAKWEHINLRSRIWLIPAENTKMRTEHAVPLSFQASQQLSQLREITGHSEWLFPNQQGRVHPVMSENTINDLIHRMGYKGRVVGHGFRSLFSTVLNERGFNRDAIERQLAHMERNSVRAAYNRANYLKERGFLMQWWADFLEAAKSGSSSISIQDAAAHDPGSSSPQNPQIPLRGEAGLEKSLSFTSPWSE